MDASTTVNFWDRLWRSSGIIFGIFFFVAYLFYGLQPKIGASADTLVSFYDGQRMRILMATMLFGWAVLILLWFAAAIRSVLHLGGVEGVPGPVPRRRGRGARDPRKERAYLSQPAPQVPNPKGSSEPRPTEQRRSS
jgi:hypothetical protein